MKIEIGKTYRTRDGRKAVATKDDGTDFYPVAVRIGDVTYYNNRDGSNLAGRQTIDDLVAEWVEPIKLEVGKFYKTRDGRTVGPVDIDLGNLWPATVGSRSSQDEWRLDGTWDGAIGNLSPNDLVSEVPSPALTVTANDHIVAVTISDKPPPASKPFVHSSREAAVTEARRLATLNPGSEFVVYQRVTAVTAELVMREAA